MPIFEYLCEECGRRFERLVPRPGADTPTCPACGAGRVIQQVSAFISPAPGRHKAAPRQHSEYPDGLIAPHDD